MGNQCLPLLYINLIFDSCTATPPTDVVVGVFLLNSMRFDCVVHGKLHVAAGL